VHAEFEPLSAELIPWITGHVQRHGTKKQGSEHIGTPLPESEGADPQDPTGSPPLLSQIKDRAPE